LVRGGVNSNQADSQGQFSAFRWSGAGGAGEIELRAKAGRNSRPEWTALGGAYAQALNKNVAAPRTFYRIPKTLMHVDFSSHQTLL
jgi:hypothetical protein